MAGGVHTVNTFMSAALLALGIGVALRVGDWTAMIFDFAPVGDAFFTRKSIEMTMWKHLVFATAAIVDALGLILHCRAKTIARKDWKILVAVPLLTLVVYVVNAFKNLFIVVATQVNSSSQSPFGYSGTLMAFLCVQLLYPLIMLPMHYLHLSAFPMEIMMVFPMLKGGRMIEIFVHIGRGMAMGGELWSCLLNTAASAFSMAMAKAVYGPLFWGLFR